MKLPVKYDDLTPDVRKLVREQYVKDQDGLCYYCKCSLRGKPSEEVMQKRIRWSLFPKHFLKWPIHLHHNRESGLTIGAVHAKCNAVLWQYEGE